MAYIGQSIKNGTFTDLSFSGTFNSSTTAFNLGTQVGSPAQLLVSKNGVNQRPGTDYTLATGGTQISFTTAPASGDSIFIVEISGAVGGPMNTDINGSEFILDVDGDTSITADTDDQIDVKIGGSDIISATASTLTVNSGVVFNENSASVDFRVESNGDANCLIVDGSGDKVGIGEDVPEGKLHVFTGDASVGPNAKADEGVFESDGHAGISILSGASNDGNIYFGDSGDDDIGFITYAHGSDNLMQFGTNAAERMRIDSSGRVGMGNTSPDARLVLEGDSSYNGKGLRLEMKNSSYSHNLLELEGGRASTNNSFTMIYAKNGNGSGIFQVLDSGNVQNTNNSYGSTSDLKLKENIASANSQWEDIKALAIKKYSLKTEESDNATQIGVIAQDLETAGMSGLVFEKNDRDEDGVDLGTSTKSVKYSVLYMKAVKALQEAITKIETLETEMTALKARVTTLEG